MRLLLALAALAATAAPIGEVRAVHRVHLDVPWEFTSTAAPFQLTEASVVAVRVDPALGRLRAAAQPIPYVDDRPLEILAVSPDGSCLVGMTPFTDLRGRRLYWGPDRLAETVDAEAGARALADAKPSIPPFQLDPGVQTNDVRLADHRMLRWYVEAMLGRCER
ncbi:MAG TPA: hypothetical protein PKA64_17415 [Myxococcota bacterium]|nr:hypothetical protein [Myxococcota bacterium]